MPGSTVMGTRSASLPGLPRPSIGEPGIYLPGRGGVRIEDTLVVRSGAAAARDMLTTTRTVTPRDLLVL